MLCFVSVSYGLDINHGLVRQTACMLCVQYNFTENREN